MEQHIDLKGRREIELFLELYVQSRGTNPFWTSTKEFSKARLSKYLTKNSQDSTCLRLIMKLINIGILEEIGDLYDKQSQKYVMHYKINEKNYFKEIRLLQERDSLFRNMTVVIKDTFI